MPIRLLKIKDSREVSVSNESLACSFRGGIAVVWLGKRDDRLVAMKQFPLKSSSKQVDQSAQVEYQMHSLIRHNSSKSGKYTVSDPFYRAVVRVHVS
jgi:hypothetical protein